MITVVIICFSKKLLNMVIPILYSAFNLHSKNGGCGKLFWDLEKHKKFSPGLFTFPSHAHYFHYSFAASLLYTFS